MTASESPHMSRRPVPRHVRHQRVQHWLEEIRQQMLTKRLGQVTCRSACHNLWTSAGARCSFCGAQK